MEAELANTAHAYVEPLTKPVSIGPSCPIDLVHLSKQTFGERELESELLRLFDRQAAQIVERLSDVGLSDRRWRADLAHTLKGSARAVGAFGVAAAAQTYEEAAASTASMDAALTGLRDSVAAAHATIAELLAG